MLLKTFSFILKNKMATITDSLITTVFKPFQEKLTIIRGCFTNCICSICECVSAVAAVFHPLIFHNMNSLNKPLSVDTLIGHKCIQVLVEVLLYLVKYLVKAVHLCVSDLITVLFHFSQDIVLWLKLDGA